MLAKIAGAIGQDATTDLQLLTYEADEDSIEGILLFGAVPLRIYYEHFLSYLALMSDIETAMRNAYARIQPYAVLIPELVYRFTT